MIAFFFLDEVAFDEVAFAKTIANDPSARDLLVAAIDCFAEVTWSAAVLHEATLQLGETFNLALRKAQAPIRCAVTGSTVGPPLFESLELLGREETLRRLRGALSRTVE